MKRLILKFYFWCNRKLIERDLPESFERKLIKEFLLNIIRFIKATKF